MSIDEVLTITISEDKMIATGAWAEGLDDRFRFTKQDVLDKLASIGIKYGIDELAVEGFVADFATDEPVVLVRGKELIKGKDADIEYLFNTDIKIRPALNDDGSVDFHNLNIINHIQEGAVLAILHKENASEAGTNIFGEVIAPLKVQKKALKYGRNIRLSDDKTQLISMCNGHVTCIDGTVFVSDVMEVDDVDVSTGNIEYEGNVLIKGNVCSNFSVKAKGDVEVMGVVEGALVEAGGNITIALGMNGMGKGMLRCDGNVISKFIENASVEAAGYIECGSIMHSNVVAGTEINVGGKKAFISGGKVTATNKIETKILGSDMGTDTVVEVGTSALMKKRYKELISKIAQIDKLLSRAIPIMEAARDKIEAGITLSDSQRDNVSNIFTLAKEKSTERAQLVAQKEKMSDMLLEDKNAAVIVTDIAYAGTKIIISDSSKIIKDSIDHSKFVKRQGDVKVIGL